MQRSKLTRWRLVLLMSGILSIGAILVSGYDYTAQAESPASQGPSSTPTLPSAGTEVNCCVKGFGCGKCIPVFLPQDVVKLLPEWGKAEKFHLAKHRHSEERCCIDEYGWWDCPWVLFPEELYKDFSQWLKSRKKDAIKESAP
jgi:hypothetical protein